MPRYGEYRSGDRFFAARTSNLRTDQQEAWASALKIGQICLVTDRDDPVYRNFVNLVEALDRLAVRQYLLAADSAALCRFERLCFADLGPPVNSPVLANCHLPDVEVAHAHGDAAGSTGLLLALTRSIPFVLTPEPPGRPESSFRRLVRRRAAAVVAPGEICADDLVTVYRRIADGLLEFPQDADGRQ